MRDHPNKHLIGIIWRSPLDSAVEFIAAIAFGSSIGILIPFWNALPDSIPIHFGITGQPDSWGPKATLLLFPAIALVSYLALTITSLFPHTFNYPVPITKENAPEQYRIALHVLRWMKVELLWLLVFIEWQICGVALNQLNQLGMAGILTFMSAIFITIGLYLRKAYLAR